LCQGYARPNASCRPHARRTGNGSLCRGHRVRHPGGEAKNKAAGGRTPPYRLYGLQPTIPHPTRASLHRCLERHGTSRLPEVEGDKPKKKRFARYPIGDFHIDVAQVSTEEGKLPLFEAIDRTSQFAFVRLVESAGKLGAAQSLRDLIAAVPCRIHIARPRGTPYASGLTRRTTAGTAHRTGA
jgi:hypothetical protein